MNNFSPLTSNSPTPILSEQTWVSRSEAPQIPHVSPPAACQGGTVYHRAPDYTALTISHSAPASHQASFERGESQERGLLGRGNNNNGNNAASNNNR